MAGAIALDLRDGKRKMYFCFCIRVSHLFVALASHSFVHAASLGLYSLARCIYQGLLVSIPGRASWLARAGGIFDGYLKVWYQLYPHRLHVHMVYYLRVTWLKKKVRCDPDCLWRVC